MGLEAVTKREMWEISEMAEFISTTLGYGQDDVDEIGQGYRYNTYYKGRTLDIRVEDPITEIKYQGKLVFRSPNNERHYHRNGSWHESFERLYSRAITEDNRRRKDLDNPEYKD